MSRNGSILKPRNAQAMRVEPLSLVVFTLALITEPTSANAQSLDPVGTERGSRIAVDRTYSFSPEEGVVQTVLYEVPINPTTSVRYTTISARFDCRARSRTLLYRTEFSGARDPQRIEYSEGDPRRSMSGPVLETQLRAVCEANRRLGELSVGEFVDADR